MIRKVWPYISTLHLRVAMEVSTISLTSRNRARSINNIKYSLRSKILDFDMCTYEYIYTLKYV